MDLSKFLTTMRPAPKSNLRPEEAAQSGRRPLLMANLKEPFDRNLGPIPKDVQRIPSMMGPDERAFLYYLARDYYSGEGSIVDGGIFLGASTYYFGKGVQDNARSADITRSMPRPVISLDRAIATQSMITTIQRSGIGMDLVAGASFEPLIRGHIKSVEQNVDLRIGDILELGAVDLPIEILFLDVLKIPQISEFAMYNYFTKLIPGRSIVIQQDYFIDGLYFIRAHQEAFGSKFEYIGELASSAVFLCTEKITSEDVDRVLLDFASLPKVMAYLDIACARSLDPCRQILMMISQVRLLAQRRQMLAANEGMTKIEALVASLGEEMLPQRVRRSLTGGRHICENDGSPEALARWYEIAYLPGHRPSITSAN